MSTWFASCLQNRGFVNYYGPQRFGSGQSVLSDRVGLALLKEDFVSAADEPDVGKGASAGTRVFFLWFRLVLFVSSSHQRRAMILPAWPRDTSSRPVRICSLHSYLANRRKKKIPLNLPLSHLSSPPTDNAKESLAMMPFSKPRERLMLRALNRYGTGPEGCAQAWLSLPHSTRVFYPHAYCSR